MIAPEEGIEPELVSERIRELREQKEALEDALSGIGAEQTEAEDTEGRVEIPAMVSEEVAKALNSEDPL